MQLNSTSSCRHAHSVNNCHLSMNVVTQLTQFVGHDVINKNTTDLFCTDWLYAVQLGQMSCVAIDTLTEGVYSDATQLDVELSCVAINGPLGCKGNYSATSNTCTIKLVHWPLVVGCYIWYSEEGTGRDHSPPRPLIAVPNVTAHPSTTNVPITVLSYNGPLLWDFNVPIKELNTTTRLISLKKVPQNKCCTTSKPNQ